MKYDWILDVLADLKIFSQNNGLDALSRHLDDAGLVAATEIAMITDAAEPEVTRDNASNVDLLVDTQRYEI